MSLKHVLKLWTTIVLRAKNRPPGHKRPPCTDGLLIIGEDMDKSTMPRFYGPQCICVSNINYWWLQHVAQSF